MLMRLFIHSLQWLHQCDHTNTEHQEKPATLSGSVNVFKAASNCYFHYWWICQLLSLLIFNCEMVENCEKPHHNFPVLGVANSNSLFYTLIDSIYNLTSKYTNTAHLTGWSRQIRALLPQIWLTANQISCWLMFCWISTGKWNEGFT